MAVSQSEYESARSWIVLGWMRFDRKGFLNNYHYRAKEKCDRVDPEYFPCVGKNHQHIWWHEGTGEIINSRTMKPLTKKRVIEVATNTGWEGYDIQDATLTEKYRKFLKVWGHDEDEDD